jgi:hypothetical protein
MGEPISIRQPVFPYASIEVSSDVKNGTGVNLSRQLGAVADSLTCVTIMDYMKRRIVGENIEGLNRAEYEPETWNDLCLKYNQCGLVDTPISSFCDSWNTYITNRQVSMNIASTFNTKFGTTCNGPSVSSPPPLPVFVMPANLTLTNNVTDSVNDTNETTAATATFTIPPIVNGTVDGEAIGTESQSISMNSCRVTALLIICLLTILP